MGCYSGVNEISSASRTATAAERRKHRRFDCGGPADVATLDRQRIYHGQIKDLSLTGCYVLTGNGHLDLDRRAAVELYLCVNDGHPLNTPARVIMVRPDSGVAFEFLPIDPEMRASLLAVLNKLSTAQPRPIA